jgi:hypothetical protein
MTHRNRRSILLLLLAIILIAVALRYPLVEHERHNDTYVMELLAGSIVDDGRAIWTFNPLSYFGYYPVSYPSGMPFLLAELSTLTGLSTTSVVLIESIMVGVFFALVVFCLARQFIYKPQYVLLATLLASVGPRLIDTSYWNGSARGLFACLAIYAVFIAFRAGSMGQRAMYGLLVVAVLGSFFLHHMAVLFVLFGLAYLLSATISYIASKFGVGRFSRKTGKWIASFTLLFLTAAILVVSLSQLSYFEKELDFNYTKSSLFSIDNPSLAIAVSLVISYTNQMGFILPIAILGIPVVLWRRRVSRESMFLMALPIVFIPLLPSSLYITLLLTPFISILCVNWITLLLEKRKTLAMVLIVLLVSASIALPVWSCDRWNKEQDVSGDMTVSDHQLFNDANYLHQYEGEAYATSNDYILSQRLAGASGTLFLRSGVISALTGDVTSETLKDNIIWMSESFPSNLYLWFSSDSEERLDLGIILLPINGINFAVYSNPLMDSGIGYYTLHSKLLVAVDNDWPEDFVWVWGVVNASLPSQLRNAEWGNVKVPSSLRPLESYSIYESQRITLFALEIPG